MKKKRADHSSSDPDASFDNPFAKLGGLRDALPPGEAAADGDEGPPAPPVSAPDAPLEKLVLRRERKGRKGKTVTLVEGLAPAALEATAKELRRSLGCGASVDGPVVVLQGAQEERARDALAALGYANVVLATGR
jgi:translation initiation factor 1